MNYIVLDLEWNQCPLGKEHENPALPMEIIEIGAVRLNDNLEETGRFHKVIKPQVYKDLHFHIKQVVHLTKEELQRGTPFKVAMKEFLDWCGEEYQYCTWGNMDLLELQRNMKFYGMDDVYTEPIRFFDVQKMFSLQYEDGELRRTLSFAVEFLKLQEKLQFHSALNDAIYTAKVVQTMDFKTYSAYVSFDYYNIPKSKKDEIYVKFPTYDKYISMGYVERDEMMKNRDVTGIKCFVCGKRCRKKIHWFSNNSKIYLSIGVCREHGTVKGKMRVRQAENGLYFVVRNTKMADELVVEQVLEKQKELRRKRRERRKRMQ